MTDWLYQIRIVVTSALSTDLRSMGTSTTAQEVTEIAKKYDMRAVCTYDAFKAYCEEAEVNGLEGYSLYNWTKATLTTLTNGKSIKNLSLSTATMIKYILRM